MDLFEFPGYFLYGCLIKYKWSGRKYSLCFSILTSGIIFLTIFILKIKWFMILIGITNINNTVMFAVIRIFTSDLYDTLIRVTTSSIYNSASRVSGVLMVFLLVWSFKLGPVGPFLFSGIIAFISAVSAFLMP